jgi:acyl carrier protein
MLEDPRMLARATETIREFVHKSFVFRAEEDGLGDRESLIEAGLIDSTGILELVAFLETAFHIEIADEDIVPENLDTVAAIAAFVGRKQSQMGSAAAIR